VITQTPVEAAAGPTGIAAKIKAFIDAAKVAAADGISVSEFTELALSLLRIAIEAADSIPSDGPSKKAWVVEAVGMLFDAVADNMIPLAAWPFWVLFRSSVRAVVLAAAGGAVEIILPMIRSKK
jgi:hypothetical protein